MRRLRIAVVLVSASLCVLAATASTAEARSTRHAEDALLIVKDQIWRTHVRLNATYWLAQPPGCHFFEDDEPLSLLDYCYEWHHARAELRIRVFFKGRTVYDEIGQGFNDSREYEHHGAWQGRIYMYEIENEMGGCYPGTYRWHVLLMDPYERPRLNKGETGYFSLRCG